MKIYHNYLKWEEVKHGMWDNVNVDIGPIIKFTGDHIKYGKAMMRVAREWKYSCEENLTNPSLNKKAWIGHAACALEHGWPEHLVRKAWAELTQEQRDLANEEAEKAIRWWIENRETNQLKIFE